MGETVVRIRYLNCRGLSADKWGILKREMEHADVLFLSETWYIGQHRQWRDQSFFASSINRNVNRYSMGRQKDGLICLIRASLHHHVSLVERTAYSIHIQLRDLSILGVYLPPSLDIEEFVGVLTPEKRPSIIIGDINVRFGVAFNDTETTPVIRREAIGNLKQSRRYLHKVPDVGITRVDHVLCDAGLSLRFEVAEAPISTDHPMMKVVVQSNAVLEQSTETGVCRFRLNRLKDARRKILFGETMHDLAGGVLEMFDQDLHWVLF